MVNFPYLNIGLAKTYLSITYYFITTKTVATGCYQRDLEAKPQTVPLNMYSVDKYSHLKKLCSNI